VDCVSDFAANPACRFGVWIDRGLFQALTSIQEMTLTFVPKLAAIVVVFWATMAYMTETLVTFFKATLIPLIVAGG